jgi:hypothetical protein
VKTPMLARHWTVISRLVAEGKGASDARLLEGWTWFVAGLGATVVVTMILFAVAGLATWSERRRSRTS